MVQYQTLLSMIKDNTVFYTIRCSFQWKRVLFMLAVNCIGLVVGEDHFGSIIGCHDDPTYEPEEGPIGDVQFTWLGGLQYIHILHGTPHYFRLPRVVLISRMFAIATAADAANVPEGYALGNVIFGEYERDAEECGLTEEQISQGSECSLAVLLIPIADVLIHPEYIHFNKKKSIALLKLLRPVRSQYVLPVCLPLENFIKTTPKSKKIDIKFYHIDYASPVPRDYDEEEKDVTILYILPTDMCYVLQAHSSKVVTANSTIILPNLITDIYHKHNSSDPIREICTTGCGLRSGAPTIVHERTGHWTVIALSEGGSPCPDPLNMRSSSPPAVHILIYPYVQWITAAITGQSRRAIERTDPFGFEPRTQVGYEDRAQKGWIGKWWMGGVRCYDRGQLTEGLFRFYHENFYVHPNPDWNNKINYYIDLEAPHDVHIVCIKIAIPYRLGTPTVWGLDTNSAKIRIKLMNFHLPYKIEIEAWGYNPSSQEGEE